MFDSISHAHLIGIGGIGLSAIAKWLHASGISVSGSDVKANEQTVELTRRGVVFFEGHAAEHLSENCDVVIYSSVVQGDNPERKEARQRGIPEYSYPEFLGIISKQFSTIVVSGTNGKSTTTAMLGLILEAAGYDPTVLVGSLVSEFPDGNLRMGRSRFFVVEGCEYRANMLNLEPEMIVLTNIEEDHLDYYRNLDHIVETFQQFVDKLKGKGLVIANGDDDASNRLEIDRAVLYGRLRDHDYFYRNRRVRDGLQTVEICHREKTYGELTLQIPGAFNVMNALAAVSSAMELGVPFEVCQKTLTHFKGIWRRFERIGTYRNVEVISDYAHHPTALKGTIEATKEFFPDRRLVVCFQPHQHDRTKKLMDDFVDVLCDVEHLFVAEIYEVAGRSDSDPVSSKELVEKIKFKNHKSQARYVTTLDELVPILQNELSPNDVLLMIGAGNIDEYARTVCSTKKTNP